MGSAFCDRAKGDNTKPDILRSWAADQIDALYATGITRGCGTDPLRFCPAEAAARAHMAAFLNRARNRPDADPQPTTPG